MHTAFNMCHSLCHRLNGTLVSNVCKAALISLFWAPNGLKELLEMHLEFLHNLTGKLTMSFLTGQS